MRWLLNALSTSVGRKVVLAITGLLLCGFLVAHLAGNLLLHMPDGGHSYNEYAHALHKQAVLLAVAEVGLFGLFIAHIVIALQVSAENRAARKVGYAVTRSKQEGRYAADGYRPDTWMLVSGIVVLGFLILHLMDFKFELRDKIFYQNAAGVDLQPFDKAMALLSSSNLITIVGYGVGCLFLAFHLAHGFQSAFQTLGINHPKYTPVIKKIGLIFAFVIGVGFASFPISGLLKGSASSAPRPKVSVLVPADHSLEPVPTPPPGTLEGVDDPSSLRPASFEKQIERRWKNAPRELQPSPTPQK